MKKLQSVKAFNRQAKAKDKIRTKAGRPRERGWVVTSTFISPRFFTSLSSAQKFWRSVFC